MAKAPTLRIDRLLANMDYGSRSDIARLAAAGAILCDGQRLRDAGQRIAITPDLPQRMQVGGAPLDPLNGMVILLHKPPGMTCSDKDDGPLVYDLLPQRWRRRDPVISAIGRLGKQTGSLLLLTDDGALLHQIISPKQQITNTYHATLARPLIGTESALFASGRMMLAGEARPLAPAHLNVSFHIATN